MLPHFVLIGAQKAGSTLLLYCLRDHPGIYMPLGETRFFEDPEYSHTPIQQLEALFDGVSGEKVLGIKRPDYLARPEVPERIHRHIPNARLIVIVRNPIERAVSAYFHLMSFSFIPVRPVEEGLRRILDGEYRNAFPKSDEILEYGFYHRHLMRYLDYFDREQIKTIVFEALTADTLRVVRQTYDFLGVDGEHAPGILRDKDRRVVNAGVYSLARLSWLRLRNPFMYTYTATRTKRYLKRRPRLADKLVNHVVHWIDRGLLARVSHNAKPRLSAELRLRLHELYAEDICRLEDWLGQSLSAWKVSAPGAPRPDAQPVAAVA